MSVQSVAGSGFVNDAEDRTVDETMYEVQKSRVCLSIPAARVDGRAVQRISGDTIYVCNISGATLNIFEAEHAQTCVSLLSPAALAALDHVVYLDNVFLPDDVEVNERNITKIVDALRGCFHTLYASEGDGGDTEGETSASDSGVTKTLILHCDSANVIHALVAAELTKPCYAFHKVYIASRTNRGFILR